MKKAIVVFMSLLSVVAYGRKKDVNVTKAETSIGLYADSTSINATVYTFPERIEEAFIDTVFGCLTVQTRGVKKEKWLDNSGDIIQYSLTDDRVLWSKDINYQKEVFSQDQGHLQFTSNDKSHGLDYATGNKTWESKHVVFLSWPDLHRSIGYYRSSWDGVSLDRLECFDTNNGNVIWKRKASRAFGWNMTTSLSDSVMLLEASGLHAINMYTGEGWDYEAVTGTNDYKSTNVANAVGVTLGMLTGVFSLTSGHDIVTGLVSNCLIDSSSVYIAFADHIVRLNKSTGAIEWRRELSKDMGSESKLFVQDGNILMVNLGTARFNGRKLVNCGTPFVAQFNMQTGECSYVKTISSSGDPIKNLKYDTENKAFYFVFQSRLSKISAVTGDVIMERVFDKEQGNFYGLLARNYCIVDNEGKYSSIVEREKGNIAVVAQNGTAIHIFNDNLEKVGEYSSKDICNCFLSSPDLRFFSIRNESTVVVNNDGNVVATLDINSKVNITNDILWQVRDNKFIMIDLKQFTK